MKDIFDDKELVIVATLILGCVSMWLLEDAEIIKMIVAGLFGIAVGRSIGKS